MMPDQFAEAMKIIDLEGYGEWRHKKMDELMCKLLRDLGYSKGVDIFESEERHYTKPIEIE